MNLSVVIPAHNEEDCIEGVIRAIEQNVGTEHEIIIVDDHCTDRTADIVGRLTLDFKNIRLVRNNNEPGFANALKTGFNNASTDIVIPVMADLCDDPETINMMYEKIKDGFDIACGSRYIKGGKRIGGPRLKAFFSFFMGASLRLLVGFPTRDISNSFKSYKKEIIRNINIESRGFEISVEIPLKAYFLGYKITEIPTVWVDRKQGESKFNAFRQAPLYLKLYLLAIWKKIYKH